MAKRGVRIPPNLLGEVSEKIESGSRFIMTIQKLLKAKATGINLGGSLNTKSTIKNLFTSLNKLMLKSL